MNQQNNNNIKISIPKMNRILGLRSTVSTIFVILGLFFVNIVVEGTWVIPAKAVERVYTIVLFKFEKGMGDLSNQ